MVEQPEFLKNDADTPAQARQVLAVGRCDVMAEHGNQPARGLVGQKHEFQERGLAGPGRAGKKMKRPRLQVKRDIAQDFRSHAVAHAHIFESHHKGSPAVFWLLP
jgi:hypothetical protein